MDNRLRLRPVFGGFALRPTFVFVEAVGKALDFFLFGERTRQMNHILGNEVLKLFGARRQFGLVYRERGRARQWCGISVRSRTSRFSSVCRVTLSRFPYQASGLRRICASANLLVLSEYYRYNIVSSQRLEAVEKGVNVCLEQLGYELYGPPFSCDNEYVQALVKSKNVPATDVPSTLRSSTERWP